jgi:hypothetical protein
MRNEHAANAALAEAAKQRKQDATTTEQLARARAILAKRNAA